MKLQTQLPLSKAAHPLGYESRSLLLGSCFSEHIGSKFEYYKLPNLRNPFGIIFHPLGIEKLIRSAVERRVYTEADVFFLNESWHCYDAHSDLDENDQEALLQNLNQGVEATEQQIIAASHIFLTLGTAWVYRHVDTDLVVANCHRAPQKVFKKELLSVQTIMNSLKEIIRLVQSVNPTAQIIFTVSPVRHLKDGFVENQRSKAHLIAAIHDLGFTAEKSAYFPAYEILMDELRDYRFYEVDMVHPNQIAIDYIWERFTEGWVSDKAQTTMALVGEIQKGLNHRPFWPESEQHQKFKKSLAEKIAYLQQEYAFMRF